MDKKENKIYDFFKKDVLSEKSVIILLTLMICVLLLYIIGMRFSANIEKKEWITATEIVSDLTLTEQESISHSSGKTDDESNTTMKLHVNINTDSIYELCLLPGIGEAKANAILEYRKENGDFHNTDELLNVNGIGQNTFNNLKEYIYVEK